MSSSSSSTAVSPSNWVERHVVTSEALLLRVAIVFHLESLLWFVDVRRLFRTDRNVLRPSTVGVRGVTSKENLLTIQQELSLLSRRRKTCSNVSSLIFTRQGGKLSIKQRGSSNNHILLDIPSIKFLRRALEELIPAFSSLSPPEEQEDSSTSWSSDEEEGYAAGEDEDELDIELHP